MFDSHVKRLRVISKRWGGGIFLVRPVYHVYVTQHQGQQTYQREVAYTYTVYTRVDNKP